MRIAIYSRVSTLKQDTENQLVQLREFAAKQGWEIVAEYTDYESGAKAERAEFQRMFQDASRRKFDLVLFWALDRLSREGVLETLQHLNRLTSYGVGYRSHTADVARLRALGLSLRAVGRQLGISEGSVRRLASSAA
jgi:DNA invertase Pin-like site-specific DNA recombinase